MGKGKGKAKGGKAEAAPSSTPGVEAMEVRHILVEKHSLCLKVTQPQSGGLQHWTTAGGAEASTVGRERKTFVLLLFSSLSSTLSAFL